MDLNDLLAPPNNSILLRVVPSTATTVGGKLVIPHKGVLDFLKEVTLSPTCRKTDTGYALVDAVDDRGDDIAELLERSPGSTGIIVASSYGISLLLHEDPEDYVMDDIVKLSHGCLLVLIETRNDPSLFNVEGFVQRLQHISGDTNLALKEPPKLLYQECEGNFVTAPVQDTYARQILQAVVNMDINFFTNDSRFAHIADTIKKRAIGWVIWPRILLYLILDKHNQTKWSTVLQKLTPTLPAEEKNLLALITENMKANFGDFSQKQESIPVGVTTTQMMLIQPMVSTIIHGQSLAPFMALSMSDTLFKRANLAAIKHANNPCPSRCIPKLSLQSPQKLVDLTIFSKPKGTSVWSGHVCSPGVDKLVVKPQTQVNFQIGNRSPYSVCWQLWNLSSNPAEQPSLLFPYSDPSFVANLTQAGKKWPSRESTTMRPPEERQLSFEMSEEGVESVILFAWWKMENGSVHYERTAQQIHVAA